MLLVTTVIGVMERFFRLRLKYLVDYSSEKMLICYI